MNSTDESKLGKCSFEKLKFILLSNYLLCKHLIKSLAKVNKDFLFCFVLFFSLNNILQLTFHILDITLTLLFFTL